MVWHSVVPISKKQNNILSNRYLTSKGWRKLTEIIMMLNKSYKLIPLLSIFLLSCSEQIDVKYLALEGQWIDKETKEVMTIKSNGDLLWLYPKDYALFMDFNATGIEQLENGDVLSKGSWKQKGQILKVSISNHKMYYCIEAFTHDDIKLVPYCSNSDKPYLFTRK